MKPILIMACMAATLVPGVLAANGITPGRDRAVTANAELALGARVFDERCAVCHTDPTAVLDLVPVGARAARQEWLDAFLPDHYASEDEIRRSIIRWLLAE